MFIALLAFLLAALPVGAESLGALDAAIVSPFAAQSVATGAGNRSGDAAAAAILRQVRNAIDNRDY